MMPRTYDDNVNYNRSLYDLQELTLPTYEQKREDELWFVSIDVGITLVKGQDGQWRQTTTPIDSDLQAAQKVFRGGYTYQISPADADDLTAAGYGAYIN